MLSDPPKPATGDPRASWWQAIFDASQDALVVCDRDGVLLDSNRRAGFHAESTLEQEDAIQAIRMEAGAAFDPEAIRVFVRAIPRATVPRKEREVLLSELTPGMVLAKGIYTSSGLLLIPEGQQLSAPYIDKLLNHNRINPINQSLVVYC